MFNYATRKTYLAYLLIIVPSLHCSIMLHARSPVIHGMTDFSTKTVTQRKALHLLIWMNHYANLRQVMKQNLRLQLRRLKVQHNDWKWLAAIHILHVASIVMTGNEMESDEEVEGTYVVSTRKVVEIFTFYVIKT